MGFWHHLGVLVRTSDLATCHFGKCFLSLRWKMTWTKNSFTARWAGGCGGVGQHNGNTLMEIYPCKFEPPHSSNFSSPHCRRQQLYLALWTVSYREAWPTSANWLTCQDFLMLKLRCFMWRAKTPMRVVKHVQSFVIFFGIRMDSECRIWMIEGKSYTPHLSASFMDCHGSPESKTEKGRLLHFMNLLGR